MPHNNWSEALQQQTREALAQLPVTADGRLHFKHATLGFAVADYADLIEPPFILHGLKQDEPYRFDSVEALLAAGWVID